MRRVVWLGLGLGLLAGCSTGDGGKIGAATPLAAPMAAEQRADILVLGTVHLRAGGDKVTPMVLDSVHRLLSGFAPDLIAVEALPPEEIHRLEMAGAAGDSSSAELLQAFTGRLLPQARLAQAHIGRSNRSALIAADSLITNHGSLTKPEHQRAAVFFLAGYDLPNAWLHWSLGREATDSIDSGVPAAIAEYLDKGLRGADERVTIGVSLARSLGLSRIESIDDHIDDEIGLTTGLNEALGEELEGHPEVKALEASGAFADRLSGALDSGDLLALFREINAPQHIAADVAGQWHLFYRTRLPSGHDRARAALWESRNLNIASRLRQAMALRAGRRALVIIGASHKPFLDAYLGMMMDVRVRHLAELDFPASLTPPTATTASPPTAPE